MNTDAQPEEGQMNEAQALTAVLSAFTPRSDWDEGFKRSGHSAVRLIRRCFTADMFMEQAVMEKRHGSHHILHHYAEIRILEKRLKSVFVLHHCEQMLYTQSIHW